MLVLLGLAGSGKSSQGQILARKHGWKWLSAGQLIRDTGRFNKIIEQGKLIDSRDTTALMGEAIEETKQQGGKVIVDGFPRDMYQAEWLVKHYKNDIKDVIEIDVPKDELVKRIKERGRKDDTDTAIKRRFEIGEQNICSILDLLRAHNIRVTTVNGVGTMAEVTARLEDVFEHDQREN